MSDLISRQKAIEALDFEIVHMIGFSNDEKNIMNPFAQYNKGLEDGIKAIRGLPSVEPKRTAKVGNIQVEWGDDEYINDRMGAMYHYGNCSNCGKTVSHSQKYCHECGARLEWK